ncbi:MAG TPA: dihydrofolate reductase family protein [Bryobacteraceae bacterium]|nr:dihydrofolate reductase family protein [Bryobacteraceae bacterium]
MRKLTVFNHVTLDGYFTDASGDMSWAHSGGDDPDFQKFTSENASGDGELLFGRITYEMMAGFWTTPAAKESMPAVAEGMNRMRKTVFSRTLASVSWSNTRLMKGDLLSEVRKMKDEAGPAMVILGSGSIVGPLAGAGLIDEYQVIVNPIALGKGRTMFGGVKERLQLKLTRSRTFGNGKVFVSYEAA